ncbi:hypothetical protein BGZ58_001918 [Dissophora ornata]|nr:hypothetical protein BGZ58_001918 [Dissophora ornata]
MNRDTTGLYQTLGVSKSSTQEEIKRAYRRLALVYHPDRARATGIADYETKFREIAAAYEILGDPQKRTVYDTYGTMGVKVAGSDFGLRFDFSHLIQHLLEFLTFLVLLVIIFFCFLSTRIDKLILWDFRIVFIPLWILDVFGVIVALLLIPVAASGVLYDDKYDDGERLGQQRRRNFRIFGILYSILDVIKVFALIAFQVLIEFHSAGDWLRLSEISLGF